MTEWNVALTADNIGGLKTGDGKELHEYVDGEEYVGNPGAMKLRWRQEIAIVHGAASKKITIPDSYSFSPGERLSPGRRGRHRVRSLPSPFRDAAAGFPATRRAPARGCQMNERCSHVGWGGGRSLLEHRVRFRRSGMRRRRKATGRPARASE
ncbi:hypothetical protein [Streptomyces sp. NPDC047000]|uniref:hypothetical protein n=1 Tax=Streptomyces sp. NPDC047000 TaxID=3155474 RepID=UPI0033EB58AC